MTELPSQPELGAAEYVNQAAHMIGLPIPPEYYSSVVENFERIQTIAQLVMDVPLPEEIEIAPVFEP
jgi:hypothetical protein